MNFSISDNAIQKPLIHLVHSIVHFQSIASEQVIQLYIHQAILALYSPGSF